VTAVPQTPSINIPMALASAPFVAWARELDPRFTLTKIEFQSVDMFGPRVGFVKFVATSTFQGKPVPGIVFARGAAVAILTVLKCGEERWVVCCRQPRLPIGRHYLEIPAGMIDGNGSFVGVAAKEMKEETGIEIKETDLIDLTQLAYGPGEPCGVGGTEAAVAGGPLHGMYPSAGGCDEFLRLMYFTKVVERDYLTALHGKLTGCVEEQENIRLELVRYEDLWRLSPDSKTLSALLLLERLAAAGKLAL
jgi:ADP-sugar diphosphatase